LAQKAPVLAKKGLFFALFESPAARYEPQVAQAPAAPSHVVERPTESHPLRLILKKSDRLKKMGNRRILAFLLAAACALVAAAQSKNSFTPMPLDSGFGPMNISAPPIAPEEIIRQFAAHESEFQRALNHYTWRRAARVQTLDEDNKVDGEYYQLDDVLFDSAGKRIEKVVYAPQSTLQRVQISPSDLQEIQQGDPFILTTEAIGQYNVKYMGRQKVDEVDCYVFDVAPKVIEKKHRSLDGRIWVDATGLQIVVTNGRMVPNGTRKHNQDLHPPVMIWRQQVDSHHWFPAYTKAEGVLHFVGGKDHMARSVHIRDTIKYSDYKQFPQ
jgi:hypothetical protein